MLRTISIAALTTTMVAGLSVTGAQATPPSRAMLQGSEVRMSVDYGGLRRDEVLRLNPDGTFSGVFERRRPVTRGSAEKWSGSMSGRWTIAGGELCLDGRGLEYRGRSCYRLTKSPHSAHQWSGAHTGTGDVWQVFVHPRGR